MDVGFEVYGDAGVLQADSQSQNFHMTQKGVATFQAATYTTRDRPNNKIVTASSPMLAINCAYPCVVSMMQNSGSQWTYTVTSASAPAGSTFTWYLFDGMNSAGGLPNYGIEVFDPNGALTFASAINPLKIVSGLAGSAGTQFNGNSSRTYAFIQCLVGRDTNFIKYKDVTDKSPGATGGFSESYLGGVCGSGFVRLVEETYCIYNYSVETSDSYENIFPAQLIVADVTGL